MKTAEDYWDDFEQACKEMQEALKKASENIRELKAALYCGEDKPSPN